MEHGQTQRTQVATDRRVAAAANNVVAKNADATDRGRVARERPQPLAGAQSPHAQCAVRRAADNVVILYSAAPHATLVADQGVQWLATTIQRN